MKTSLSSTAPGSIPTATRQQSLRAAGRLLRTRGPLTVLVLLVLLVDAALALAGPVAVGQVVQAISTPGALTAGSLVPPLLLLVTTTVAGTLSIWASTLLLARLVLPAMTELRESVLDAALHLPSDVVEANGTGDLVSRVSTDAESVSDVVTGALGSFVSALLILAVTLGGLASLDPRYALAALLGLPVQVLATRSYIRASSPVYAKVRISEGQRASTLLTVFGQRPLLRTLRRGPWAAERARTASRHTMALHQETVVLATRFFSRLNLAEFLGLGGILLTAWLLMSRGESTLGQATTAALFFAGLFGPINVLLGTLGSLQDASAGFARLIGVRLASRDAPQKPFFAGASAVAVTDLSFGYRPGTPVLKGISLAVHDGERLALVGSSGSGKSTLGSLLAGLREPDSGSVRWGHEPRPGSAGVILISQQTHVFTGTLASNLRLARPDASIAELEAALRKVHAWDWVEGLPLGLDTPTGAGHPELTGIQAQLLALARVVLLDPWLLIMDEATAEAGSDASRTLDLAAAAACTGRTTVTIAHRLSQAAAADRIVVLEEGQILETGTHTELLDLKGRYAHLWAAWQG